MSPDNWLYHYQTLVSGLLAVLAASGAVWTGQAQVRAVRDQIAASQKQANLDRASRHRAARATLPVTLSAICEYAQATGQALNSEWPGAAKRYPESHDGTRVSRITVSLPDFPSELLRSLERVVETTDANDVAECIESILREVQILAARTRPLARGADITTDDLAGFIIQAAAIYARAETLFTYARRRTEGVNNADLWGRLDAALHVMRIYTPAVRQMAQRQRERGASPGEADRDEPD